MSDVQNDANSLSNPWQRRGQIGFFPAVIQTLWQLFTRPVDFFTHLETGGTIKDAYLFYLVIMLPMAGIQWLMDNLFYHQFPQYLIMNVTMVVFISLGNFIFAGGSHLFVRLFKGKGTFNDTFN